MVVNQQNKQVEVVVDDSGLELTRSVGVVLKENNVGANRIADYKKSMYRIDDWFALCIRADEILRTVGWELNLM